MNNNGFNEISNTETYPDLIIGGAGFIGTNLARRLLSSGRSVRIFDNLSRAGVENNLNWLCEKYGNKVDVIIGDIRDKKKLDNAVKNVSRAFHFAAQVAVTTSIDNPEFDFDVNIRGTFNLLEAIRGLSKPLPLIFTSTNKVYGGLEDMRFTKNGTRYLPDEDIKGINEMRSLDFHSPYGCSKGAADQYVLDYARSYRLLTTVFRMSCVYGPHQFGTEDQGWIAHFLIRAIKNDKIIIYGDGKQVRDILFVDDLIDALLAAQNNLQAISGNVFNIGGGRDNTVSLIELIDRMKKIAGIQPVVTFEGWRIGDQKYYVSDTSKFQTATGWYPKTAIDDGLRALYEWLINNYDLNTGRSELIKQEKTILQK